MERPVAGDIMLLELPYTDLSGSKTRPVFVLTKQHDADIICCLITSRSLNDDWSVPLCATDLVRGGLRTDSTIRTDKIFTRELSRNDRLIATVNEAAKNKVRDKLAELLL